MICSPRPPPRPPRRLGRRWFLARVRPQGQAKNLAHPTIMAPCSRPVLALFFLADTHSANLQFDTSTPPTLSHDRLRPIRPRRHQRWKSHKTIGFAVPVLAEQRSLPSSTSGQTSTGNHFRAPVLEQAPLARPPLTPTPPIVGFESTVRGSLIFILRGRGSGTQHRSSVVTPGRHDVLWQS